MPLKLAVLLSGNGTTFQNILDQIEKGKLDAEIVCLLSSRDKAFGLERAKKAGVPTHVVSRKQFQNPADFSDALWAKIDPYQPELIVLAGFMSLIDVPERYSNRIINVHPALIPAFCGKGMYGSHVHQAVLDCGAKVTGVTVHFVDNQYDHGPIILQSVVPVIENDTVETLQERVQAEERILYPSVIRLFADGRIQVRDRYVRILQTPDQPEAHD